MLTVLSANGPSGYRIPNSLRFRSSASAYLSRTPAAAGNRQTWTWSGWVKRGALGVDSAFFSANNNISLAALIRFTSTDVVRFYSNDGANSQYFDTTAVFRDPSAWYHVVAVHDTTQTTAANRLRIWVNGVQQTGTTTGTLPQNANGYVNSTVIHNIGAWAYTTSPHYFDGYLADINFIDGQALTPSSFGETNVTTGVWQPKQYSGTYGTNGFKLNFSNGTSTTTLGYDSSGNGNNWTTNNISLTAGSTYDWMLDSPTPYQGSSYGVGNYAVLNPNDKASANIAISNGNLTATGSSTNHGVRGSFGVTSGSWYYEASVNGTAVPAIGIATSGWVLDYVGDGVGAGNIGYHANGIIYSNGLAVQSGLASYTSGDIVGVAYNVTSGSIQFYKNNVAIGTAVTGFAGLNIFPAVSTQTSTVVNVNFGQRPFAFSVPSGFKALNTQNLP